MGDGRRFEFAAPLPRVKGCCFRRFEFAAPLPRAKGARAFSDCVARLQNDVVYWVNSNTGCIAHV